MSPMKRPRGLGLMGRLAKRKALKNWTQWLAERYIPARDKSIYSFESPEQAQALLQQRIARKQYGDADASDKAAVEKLLKVIPLAWERQRRMPQNALELADFILKNLKKGADPEKALEHMYVALIRLGRLGMRKEMIESAMVIVRKKLQEGQPGAAGHN